MPLVIICKSRFLIQDTYEKQTKKNETMKTVSQSWDFPQFKFFVCVICYHIIVLFVAVISKIFKIYFTFSSLAIYREKQNESEEETRKKLQRHKKKIFSFIPTTANRARKLDNKKKIFQFFSFHFAVGEIYCHQSGRVRVKWVRILATWRPPTISMRRG